MSAQIVNLRETSPSGFGVPVAVILNDGRRVTFDRINDEEHSFVSMVEWADGTLSYGKSWSIWNGERHLHYRVGAGAYGDSTVWIDQSVAAQAKPTYGSLY